LPQNGSPRVYLWALSPIPAYYKGLTRDQAQSLSSRHSYAAPPNMSEKKHELVSSQPKVRVFAVSPRDPEPSDRITAVSFLLLFVKAYWSDESGWGQKRSKSTNRTGRQA